MIHMPFVISVIETMVVFICSCLFWFMALGFVLMSVM